MTTELEKQFFKTFGIEPQKLCFNCDCVAKDEIGYDEKICDDRCVYIEREYPKITDRVLLELICVLSQYFYLFEDLHVKTVSELKDCVLQKCITTIIDDTDEIHQIQQIFKERK